jgi:hypothetical protein
MKLKTFLFSSFLMFILSSCATTQENPFKNTAITLKDLLSKIQIIENGIGSQRVELDDGRVMYYRDNERVLQFVEENKGRWEILRREFSSYMEDHAKSQWSDDAGFCLVMMYLNISIGRNQYNIIAANEIKTFLKRFPAVHIEDWTRAEFEDVPFFRLILMPDTAHWPDSLIKQILELPEERRVKEFFTVQMIMELLKAGMRTKARDELEELQKQSMEDRELAIAIHNMIERSEREGERIGKEIPPLVR